MQNIDNNEQNGNVSFLNARQNLDCCQFNIPFTETEIADSIKQLHVNKSPGPDGICVELYKCITGVILPFLKKLINGSFGKGDCGNGIFVSHDADNLLTLLFADDVGGFSDTVFCRIITLTFAIF